MILNNAENLKEYDISKDWYKNRKKGISAYMRVKNEEKWIGPCIESIMDFFDEIIVALDGNDRTRKILESFNSSKIKIYDYPFKLIPPCKEYPIDSVHNVAYYYNWTLSKTTYNHVSKWDATMIMLPEFCTQEFYNKVLKNNVIRMKGYDVVTEDFKYVSKHHPWSGPEIRFFKVNKHIHHYPNGGLESLTYQGLLQLLSLERWMKYFNLQLQRIKNLMIGKDIKLRDPGFIKTKYLREWNKMYIDTDERRASIGRQAEKGVRMDIEPPSFVFKRQRDYLR